MPSWTNANAGTKRCKLWKKETRFVKIRFEITDRPMRRVESQELGWGEIVIGLAKFFAVCLLLVVGFWVLCFFVFCLLGAFLR